jgi:glycogen operon protein
VEDISWFLPNGTEMPEENWNLDYAKSLGVFMNGRGIRTTGPKGERTIDDSFYVIFNSHYDSLNYTLPSVKYGNKWILCINTESAVWQPNGPIYFPGQEVTVAGRSIVLLQHPIRSLKHPEKRG